MRNMHGGQAVEAWTSDSAAEHISILEEKRWPWEKIKVFQRSPALMPIWKTVMQRFTQTVNDAFPRSWMKSAFSSLFSSLAPLLGWLIAYWHVFLKLGSLLLRFSKPPANCGRLLLACLCGVSTISGSSCTATGAWSNYRVTCPMPQEGMDSERWVPWAASHSWARRRCWHTDPGLRITLPWASRLAAFSPHFLFQSYAFWKRARVWNWADYLAGLGRVTGSLPDLQWRDP